MRVGVLVNPAAGGGRPLGFLPEVLAHLASLGWTWRVAVTQRPGDEVRATKELLGAGAELVVALGGDGTFHGVARALLGSGVALLPIPLGRGNDWTRALYGRLRPRRVLLGLGSWEPAPVDVIVLEWNDLREPVINGMGLGFDALVARMVARARGIGAYLVGVGRALDQWKPVRLRGPFGEVEALMAGAGVGRWLGGGFALFPKADPWDGLMDFYLIRSIPKWRILVELPRAALGLHLGLPQVKYFQTRMLELELPEAVPAQLDGEPRLLGPGTLQLRSLAGVLPVLSPFHVKR